MRAVANERYLLDTHVLLWMDEKPGRIGFKQQAALDSGLEIYFSAASAWELAIKRSLGKLSMKRPITALTERLGFLELPVTAQYADIAATLPPHHGDPFDRMLVAQAQREGLILVTADHRLASYDVSVMPI
jgi:PIN domain nuclease of toxin-antitoxin system